MKKKYICRTILLFLGLFLVFAVIFGLKKYNYYLEMIAELNRQYDNGQGLLMVERSKEIEGAVCIVTKDEYSAMSFHSFDDYLYYGSSKIGFENIFAQKTRYRNGRIVISFLDIETGELVKEIDLAKVVGVREIDSSFEYYCRNIEGERCLLYFIDINNTNVLYIISIDDESVIREIRSEDEESVKLSNEFKSLIEEENKKNLSASLNQQLLCNESYMEANGLVDKLNLKVNYGYDMGKSMYLKLSDLPEENDRLYSEFPQLLYYKENAVNTNECVSFLFPYTISADEIVEMFVEEGTSVSYEGVFIPKDYTNDGKEHMISCLDEYLEYIDESKLKSKAWYSWD